MRITTQSIDNTIIEILEKTEKALLDGKVYRYLDKDIYDRFSEDIKNCPSLSFVDVIEGKQKQLLYELAFDKMVKLGLCKYTKEDILMFTEIYRVTLEGYEFVDRYKEQFATVEPIPYTLRQNPHYYNPPYVVTCDTNFCK